jgi:hypothetical protein
LSRREPKFERRLFHGFSLWRYFAKWFGLFVFMLGVGTAFSDWSFRIKAVRDSVSRDGTMVFEALFFWMVLGLIFEILRLKLKRDIAQVRWENRRRPKSRPGQR